MQGKITKVEMRIEPLGIMPDGSLALTKVIDIWYQPVKAAEFITLTHTIKKDEDNV